MDAIASEVGVAYVRLIPSMKGFSAAVSKEMSGSGFNAGVDAAAKKAESRLARFNKTAKVASAAVIASFAAVGKQSVELASSQAANFSKFEQVTKTAMDSAHMATARSLNLSRGAYADYYAQLSAMYQSNGIGTKKANQMAAESMKTAADAAAFGNTTVGEAVEAQLGLLKGSGELWEKYSVSIKASDVAERVKVEQIKSLNKAQQEQWKNLGKLEPAERKAAKAKLESQMADKKALEAQVKHTLAQEKAALFLGQAAKESGSLESRQQQLKATTDDLGASLGAVLLPAAVAITAKLQTFALWAERNQQTVKVLAVSIGGLAASVWVINGAVKAATATKKAWTAVSKGAALAQKGLATASSAAVRGITAAASAAGRAALATGRWAAATVVGAAKATAAMVTAAARQAAAWTVMAAKSMAAAARVAAAWLISMGPIAIVAAAVAGLVYLIVKNWAKIKSTITSAATAVLNFVKAKWPLLLAILTGPFGLAVLAIAKNWDRIVGTAKAIPGKIKGALSGMASLLIGAGEDLVRGMIKGIGNMAGNLISTVKDKLVNAPKNLVSGLWGMRSPSKVTAQFGRYITEGFIKGIEASGPKLTEALKKQQDKLKEKLKERVAELQDMAREIRGAFTVDLAATDLGMDGVAGPSLATRLAEQADAAEKFAATIARLRKGGLRESLVQQLVREGPAALAAAQEIAGNIGMVNKLAARIEKAGQTLSVAEVKVRTGVNLGKTKGKIKIPKMHSGGVVPGSGESLRILQGGEGVFTPDQMRALGSGSRGAAVAPVNLIVDGSGDRRYLEWIRNLVRVESGGDAQAFFGQR